MLIVKDGTKNEEGGGGVGVPNYSAQPCFESHSQWLSVFTN